MEISDDLRWSYHCTRITNKANSTLGFVRRNLYHCPPLVKKIAYMSLVRPPLEYCSSVWDPHTLTNINILEMVQRRAARFVVNDHNRDSSVSNIISKLEWPSLQIRRMNNRLTWPPLNLLQGEITTLSSSNTPPSLTVLNTHSFLELSLNGIP